jgi:ATP-dependent helicase/nuclease subunit A
VHFEKYLRLLGVPYGSENACGLFSEAVACDLYYALRSALYPEDLNALAAYLRSPFAALSDEAIVRLLLEVGERGIDPLGAGAAALLPEADRAPHGRGAATIGRLSERVDREPISATLSWLWFEAGYRASLLRDPVASAFEEHFELLHSMAADADSRRACLASFVAELESLVGEPDKLEVDLPRDGSAGVRIMTIHKSKGLEFPVVIVPQANNAGAARASREAWFWDEATGPTFKPPAAVGTRSRNAFFDRSRERREAMEAAELKRLLYVALTRAESHLIVTATQARNEDSRGRSFRSLLAAPLGLFEVPSPLAASEGAGELPRGAALPPFGPVTELPSGALVGLIPERSEVEYWALVAGARAAAGASREQLARTAAALPRFERKAGPLSSTVTGEAEALASEAEALASKAEALDIAPELAPPEGLSPETWGSLAHAVLESRLSTVGGERGIDTGLRSRIEDALGGPEAFRGSELGRRALASSERHAELAVALAPEGPASPNESRYLKGVIDLAFVEGERVVVVDYKTDSAIVPGIHALQVAAYGRAASEIFGRPAESWIFYLYGGGRALRVDEDGSAPRPEEAPEPSPRLGFDFQNPSTLKK